MSRNLLLIRIVTSAYLCMTDLLIESSFLVRPEPGSTVEVIHHLQTALCHTTKILSCKCGCNFPATQHGANPPTNCMPKPKCQQLLLYIQKSYGQRPSQYLRKLQMLFPSVSLHSLCVWPILLCSFSGLTWLVGKVVSM